MFSARTRWIQAPRAPSPVRASWPSPVTCSTVAVSSPLQIWVWVLWSITFHPKPFNLYIALVLVYYFLLFEGSQSFFPKRYHQDIIQDTQCDGGPTSIRLHLCPWHDLCFSRRLEYWSKRCRQFVRDFRLISLSHDEAGHADRNSLRIRRCSACRVRRPNPRPCPFQN